MLSRMQFKGHVKVIKQLRNNPIIVSLNASFVRKFWNFVHTHFEVWGTGLLKSSKHNCAVDIEIEWLWSLGVFFPREFPCMAAIDARRDHEICRLIPAVMMNKIKKRLRKLIRNFQRYKLLSSKFDVQNENTTCTKSIWKFMEIFRELISGSNFAANQNLGWYFLCKNFTKFQ